MVMRPALVVSARSIGTDGALAWVAMITNAAREPWPGDVEIDKSVDLGLIVPSKVRTSKISTIEIKSASLLGKVDGETLARVRREIAANLGL